MAQDWVIRGLPARIAMDSWWLEGPERGAASDLPGQRTGMGGRLAALAVLVLLADFLFYERPLGLSLALFALAVFAAAALLRPVGEPLAGPLVLLVMSALPVVDHLQALSLGFLALGMLTSIAWMVLGSRPGTLAATLRLAQSIPLGGVLAIGFGLWALRREAGTAGLPRRLWRAWAFPLGGCLVLLYLLVAANPILGDWLEHLTRLDGALLDWLIRAGFWLGIGLLVWPFLAASHEALRRPVALPRFWLPGIGINADSVGKALVAFNLLLAVQTTMDLRYLWSGASLPPGMTLATYAHRGAYPLLATALLAGAFALAARPWLGERRMLKPLLLLWLGQNVALTLAALYRLDLYVQSFGLTYLRVHAGIWMLLVAAGLALTGWQVARGRSNLWLMIRCAVLAAATLYACAFVNFAAIIATENLRAGKVDVYYLCELGPNAAAAIPDDLKWTEGDSLCNFRTPQIDGWRDWGFREWRVIRNLRADAQREGAVENPGRR
jgi:hypothetical protein